MIFPSNRVRITVATKPSTSARATMYWRRWSRTELHKDPFTETVFVFRPRKVDRLKLICWDGSGLAMTYKQPPAAKSVLCPITHQLYFHGETPVARPWISDHRSGR
ncbi:IS66 family insertion sequence element accessory protein TnpB [Rhizobium sp. 16-449-1b]|nr:IS66 family insertion sequence element accessory protein TnpB [Rhizobium sp. 16-449-1b]